MWTSPASPLQKLESCLRENTFLVHPCCWPMVSLIQIGGEKHQILWRAAWDSKNVSEWRYEIVSPDSLWPWPLFGGNLWIHWKPSSSFPSPLPDRAGTWQRLFWSRSSCAAAFVPTVPALLLASTPFLYVCVARSLMPTWQENCQHAEKMLALSMSLDSK